MNLVFLVERQNFYKYFSSIIEEGLKRGHTVECWHDYTQPRLGMKNYLFPRIENSPFYNSGKKNLVFVKLKNEGDFEKLLTKKKENNDDGYFIGLNQMNVELDKSLKEYLSGKWCIIMHGIDNFYELTSLPSVNDFNYKIYIFVHSKYIFQFGFEWLKNNYPEKSFYLQNEHTTIVPIGSTIIGNKDKLSSIDRKNIRKNFDISDRKNIVLYLPFAADAKLSIEENDAWWNAFAGIYCSKIKLLKRQNIEISFIKYFDVIIEKIISIFKIFKYKESRKYFIKGYNEPKVFKAIKKFCTKNNLLLVVKPRKKYAVTEYVRNNADIFVNDDEKKQYPTILQDLFSISDLIIGHFSVAVLESISFGKPYLNIESSKLGFIDQAHRSLFLNDEDSMFNFKSSVYNWSASKMISDFGKMSISDFKMDSKAREEYMRKFIGPIDGSAAERFYDYLENLYWLSFYYLGFELVLSILFSYHIALVHL